MDDGELHQVAPPETTSFVRNGTVFAELPSNAVSLSNGDRVTLGVRPGDATLDTDGDGTLTASATVSEHQGNDNFVHLDAGDVELTTRVPPVVYPDAGDDVGVTVSPEDVYLFDIDSGRSTKTRGIVDSEPSIRTPPPTD